MDGTVAGLLQQCTASYAALCSKRVPMLLQDAPTEAEMKLLDMLAAIIQNMVRMRQPDLPCL